jgi:hypothetical protein
MRLFCPPLARDRLIGLSGAGKSLVGTMEAGSIRAKWVSAHGLTQVMTSFTVIPPYRKPAKALVKRANS